MYVGFIQLQHRKQAYINMYILIEERQTTYIYINNNNGRKVDARRKMSGMGYCEVDVNFISVLFRNNVEKY